MNNEQTSGKDEAVSGDGAVRQRGPQTQVIEAVRAAITKHYMSLIGVDSDAPGEQSWIAECESNLLQVARASQLTAVAVPRPS